MRCKSDFDFFCEEFRRDGLDLTENSTEYLKQVFYFSLCFDDELAEAIVRVLLPPEKLKEMTAQKKNTQNKTFRRLLLDFVCSTPGIEGAAVPCSGDCPKADEETAILREYGVLPNAALPPAFDSDAIFARRGAVPNSLSSARIGTAKMRNGETDFVPTDLTQAVGAFRLPAQDVPQVASSYFSTEYAVGAGPLPIEGYVASRLRGDEARCLRIIKEYCPRVFLERAGVSDCQTLAADWLDAAVVDYLYARKGDEALGRETFSFSSSKGGDFERFKRASAKLFSVETTAEEAETEIATLLNLNEAGYAVAGTAVYVWDGVQERRRARSYRLSIKDPIAAFMATCAGNDFRLSETKKKEIKETFFYRDALFIRPNAYYFTSEETLDRWFDAAERESPFLGVFPVMPSTGAEAEKVDRRLQAALQSNFEIDFVAEANLVRARIAALRQDWATCDSALTRALARLRIEAASALVGRQLNASVDWTSDDFAFDSRAAPNARLDTYTAQKSEAIAEVIAQHREGKTLAEANAALESIPPLSEVFQTKICDMFQSFAPRTEQEKAAKIRLAQTRKECKRILRGFAVTNGFLVAGKIFAVLGKILLFLAYLPFAAISYFFLIIVTLFEKEKKEGERAKEWETLNKFWGDAFGKLFD